MTSRSNAVALLFVLLEGLVALILFGTSVHGVAGQAIAAPIYFVIAAGITIWVARHFASAIAVAGIGSLMLVTGPGVILALGYVEEQGRRRRIAATRIADVRDEPIISASGRPIGVRLTYTVRVPRRGYFSILPSLSSREPRSENLRLESRRWTVDGRSEPTPFDDAKTHTMVVELYPHILFIGREQWCIQSSLVPTLPDSSAPAPLRAAISESTYGNTHHGGEEQWTRGAYDLVALYRSILAEGLASCARPG